MACLYKLVLIAFNLLETLSPEEINYSIIEAKLHDQDLSTVRIYILAFIVIWVFGIIDAFLVGVRLEKKEPDEAL